MHNYSIEVASPLSNGTMYFKINTLKGQIYGINPYSDKNKFSVLFYPSRLPPVSADNFNDLIFTFEAQLDPAALNFTKRKVP